MIFYLYLYSLSILTGGGKSNSWGNSYSQYSYNSKNSDSSSGFGDIIVLGVICLVIYAFYKTCIDTPQNMGDRQYSSTGSDYPGGAPGGGAGGGAGGGGGWFNPGGNNQNPGKEIYSTAYTERRDG